MPHLDVSEALTDPDFTDIVDVIRRAESVDQGGLSEQTPTTFRDVVAVVTAGDGESLVRSEDEQLATNTITVHTKFRLIGPAPGYQPDVVVWNGNQYVVRQLKNWSQFGAGYVSAQCESMDLIDQPTQDGDDDGDVE